jgi:hypothetical protein
MYDVSPTLRDAPNPIQMHIGEGMDITSLPRVANAIVDFRGFTVTSYSAVDREDGSRVATMLWLLVFLALY